MELLGFVLGVFNQQIAWFELWSIEVLELKHPIVNHIGTMIIQISEWSAEERWETKAKDGADVTLKLQKSRMRIYPFDFISIQLTGLRRIPS